jgi:Fanconi-associated nuclease 1
MDKDKDKWKGKSVWQGRDGDEVSVETLALQYYENLGYRGFVHPLVSSVSLS